MRRSRWLRVKKKKDKDEKKEEAKDDDQDILSEERQSGSELSERALPYQLRAQPVVLKRGYEIDGAKKNPKFKAHVKKKSAEGWQGKKRGKKNKEVVPNVVEEIQESQGYSEDLEEEEFRKRRTNTAFVLDREEIEEEETARTIFGGTKEDIEEEEEQPVLWKKRARQEEEDDIVEDMEIFESPAAKKTKKSPLAFSPWMRREYRNSQEIRYDSQNNSEELSQSIQQLISNWKSKKSVPNSQVVEEIEEEEEEEEGGFKTPAKVEEVSSQEVLGDMGEQEEIEEVVEEEEDEEEEQGGVKRRKKEDQEDVILSSDDVDERYQREAPSFDSNKLVGLSSSKKFARSSFGEATIASRFAGFGEVDRLQRLLKQSSSLPQSLLLWFKEFAKVSALDLMYEGLAVVACGEQQREVRVFSRHGKHQCVPLEEWLSFDHQTQRCQCCLDNAYLVVCGDCSLQIAACKKEPPTEQTNGTQRSAMDTVVCAMDRIKVLEYQQTRGEEDSVSSKTKARKKATATHMTLIKEEQEEGEQEEGEQEEGEQEEGEEKESPFRFWRGFDERDRRVVLRVPRDWGPQRAKCTVRPYPNVFFVKGMWFASISPRYWFEH